MKLTASFCELNTLGVVANFKDEIMAGLVGAVSDRDVAFKLLECLKIMEYKECNATTLMVLGSNANINLHKCLGKIDEIYNSLNGSAFQGETGFCNASWIHNPANIQKKILSPVSPDEIVLVKKGIIGIRESVPTLLANHEHQPYCEADVDFFCDLIHHNIKSGLHFLHAVREAEHHVEGSYSIVTMRRSESQRLLALRRGSPLVIGFGNNENFVASHLNAIVPFIESYLYLEEGDIADIRQHEVIIYDENNERVERTVYQVNVDIHSDQNVHINHFIKNEIFEQPHAILSMLQRHLSHQQVYIESFGKQAHTIFQYIQRVQIISDKESFNAALVGRYWIEELSGLPCQVQHASKNRYNLRCIENNTLFVTLSPSGEDAETIATLNIAKQLGYGGMLTIGNIPNSTLARESDLAIITTDNYYPSCIKPFASQLSALLLLAVALGRFNTFGVRKEAMLVEQLENFPKKIQQILKLDARISELAHNFADKRGAVIFANGIQYPVAMEGAQQLKEIAAMQVEVYPVNEFSRVSSVLIDPEMPVIALSSSGGILNRFLQEVVDFGANLTVIADKPVSLKNSDVNWVNLPWMDKILSPIAFVIPMQLLAYHVSVLKGIELNGHDGFMKSKYFREFRNG